MKGHNAVRTLVVVWAAVLLLVTRVDGYVFEESPFGLFYPAAATDSSEFGITLSYFENIFLVGSPSNDNSKGALYACHLTAFDSVPIKRVPCSALAIDDSYGNGNFEGDCKGDTTHQRLGAALTVSGKKIMVCAPNWSNTCTKKYGGKYSSLVGTCFLSDSLQGPFSGFTPVYYYNNTNAPPRYYLTDGFCQAGFSVAFAQQGSGEVVFGAPGCYSWGGDVFFAKTDDAYSLMRRGAEYTEADIMHSSASSSKVAVNNRYVGYTVAQGIFAGQQMVVASAPKEGVLKNKKVFDAATYILSSNSNTESLDVWSTLFISGEPEHEWEFAYCGFSLAVVDFDLDGLDDVAVGCPHYGNDTGAFVIFFQRKNGGTYEMEREDGSKTWRAGQDDKERFASAFTSIGDVDDDSYPEFAVGAPGALEGKGKVYIFCGREGGLSKDPCQVLKASEGLRGLGVALASGMRKLAVSMTSPNEVVVYRTRRVLEPQLKLKTNTPLPILGNDEVPVEVCLSYFLRGSGLDSTSRSFKVILHLDYNKEKSRLEFSDVERGSVRTDTLNITAETEECLTYAVRKKNAQSEGMVSYLLRANISLDTSLPSAADVVVDRFASLEAISTLRPSTDCDGRDCLSKVVVSLESDTKYTYEETNKLNLTVNISVSEDPAYFSELTLLTKNMLSVSGKPQNLCQSTDETTCEFDIIENAKKSLFFTLLPSEILKNDALSFEQEFEITAIFSSYSNFTSTSTPQATIYVPIALDSKFFLTSDVTSSSMKMGESQKVTFIFSLRNENSYSYTVIFTVEANSDCAKETKLEDNSNCKKSDASNGAFTCEYEYFSKHMKEKVAISATIEGKEKCENPVKGVATFSKLPFNFRWDNKTVIPVFTITEKLWYETWWWITLLVLGLALVVLLIVVFACFLRRGNSNKGDNQNPTEDENAQQQASPNEDNAAEEEERLDPEQHHP